MKNIFFTLFCCCFCNGIIWSQDHVEKNEPKQEPLFKNSLGEMKIKFDETGDKFLKFGVSSQVWFRSIENNPGTAVNGVPQDHTIDAGVRRVRITMQSQLSKGYSVFFQFGINNQSFISGGGSGTGANGQGKKPGMFFMDAYNELAIVPQTNFYTNETNKYNLYIGAGLHSWNGISRLSNASTTKLLTADLPVFNFPNIEVSDQFSRQFGIFLRGDLDRINYRFSVNKPFATDRKPEVGEVPVENNGSGKLSYAGYAMYQFLDKESTATSFLPGTYLGSKSIFNIGAGFYTNKEALLSQPEEGVFKTHDQLNLGIDAFVEVPIGVKEKEMSLSVYSVYYYNDFGKNNLRTNGIMNPGTADTNYTGSVAAEGFGNAKYLIGAGSIWYTQAGFVLPNFSKTVKLQPFAAYHYKDLDGLNQAAHFYDIGANLFVFSQNAKIAAQYSSRPLYDQTTKRIFDRKGEFILSFQVAL